MNDKLLILSDLHVTEPGETIIGLDPAARLSAALDHALARHGDARAVLLLGDLTHHGRTAQYVHLQSLLASCPLPVFATLGNHDSVAGFTRVFPGQLDAEGFAQHAFDIGPVRVLVLDTLDRDGRAPRHGGWLCERRLHWLERHLASAEGRPVLLACHHPPFATGFEGMDAINLANGNALLERLRAARGPVQLVCGHVHRAISGSVGGIGWTVLKSPCHQMPLLLGPGATTLSVDEPGGYAVALGLAEGAVLHMADAVPDRPVGRDLHSG